MGDDLLMYDFNNAVRLNRTGGEYVITVDGKPLETSLSANQRRNPLIAVSRYASAIDEYLRGNVKKYLAENELNVVTGCNVCMECTDCKFYHLNDAESNCRLGDNNE